MKKLSLTLLFVVCGLWLFAAPVSIEAAQKVAVKFYRHYAPDKTDFTISNVVTYQKDGLTTFYTFVFNGGGFVLVSADDAVIPVLGYSEDGIIDDAKMPLNMKNWLDDYSKQIKYIIDNKLDNTQTLKEWDRIRNDQLSSAKLIVNPLCTTLWDQSAPYNNLCPGGSVTGCIATAMAQIMKKWNYPTTGVGSHTYTPPGYSAQTANFGATTYAWANMINDYSGGSSAAQKTAVATLMFHCGVSVNMQYSTSGSGAYTWDVPPALINYFAYQNTAELKIQANFTNTNWINMLKADLDAGRPILYSGDNGAEGHAFVFDGYNSSNQFHVNWGWSGYSNQYYSVGSLNPSGYSFNLDNMAVVRIHPPSNAPVADFIASTTTPAVAGSVTFTDQSTGSPTSWTWAFEGGSPATYTGQTPPAITYSTAGNYQVSLTVSNTNGSDTKVKSQYINVGGTPSAWIKQNSGFTTAARGIDQIFIVNPYIVWAKAYDGTSSTNIIREFTKTNNGGITWTPGTIAFTGSTSYGVANLYAFNDTICYACMYPTATHGGYIVKTLNGGTTWTIQSSANFAASWADFVYFFNENEGVCVGDPTTTPHEFMIYTTTNGGTTWTQVPIGNIANPLTSETAIADQFDVVGNTMWFGTSAGRVYKSTDKGLNWTATTVTGFGTTIDVTPVFKDANVGLAVGVNTSTSVYAGIKKTVNGGSTWTALTPTGYFVKYPQLDFVPGTAAMWVNVSAGPYNKGSSYSINDGTSFLNIDTGSVQYTSVAFYDINTGWAGGFNASASDGGIYKWQNNLLVGIDEKTPVTEDIHIYPNPTRGIVNVEFSMFADKKAEINVYNLVGEKILTQEYDPTFNNLLHLDLSGKVPGIYMITVSTLNNIVTKKVLLSR